jgi:hypothetical protein
VRLHPQGCRQIDIQLHGLGCRTLLSTHVRFLQQEIPLLSSLRVQASMTGSWKPTDLLALLLLLLPWLQLPWHL